MDWETTVSMVSVSNLYMGKNSSYIFDKPIHGFATVEARIMARDRITNIRIKGLRTLKDVNLRLNGLHVLIGENGTGKSSTIEAIEICRRLASPSFFDELNHYHGGMRNLFDEGTRFF